MLDYYTLLKKPSITLKSNVEGAKSVKCLDLLANKRMTCPIIDCDCCEVTEYYVGRPDLISFVYYGTDIYGDVICKVNGISNPFEMNIGDILIVPSLFYAQVYVLDGMAGVASEMVDDNESIISNYNSKYKKLRNESRSPNELTIDKNNYVIDKSRGLIFY